MKSFQKRMLEQFEAVASEHDCELVQQQQWANTGTLLAMRAGNAIDFVARVHYDIQCHGLSKFWFNDADHLSPWFSVQNGEPFEKSDRLGNKWKRNPDVFYVESHDSDRLTAMFTRWAQLLPQTEQVSR